MATNYTYLNEISASDGFYALDNTPPAISVLYNNPANKVARDFINVAINIYDLGGIDLSGVNVNGFVTPISAFTQVGNNFTFNFNVSATGSVTISATDKAGNSNAYVSTGYTISAVPTDTVPPIITFFNQTPSDKNLSSSSIGSLRVRVTDNYSITSNPSNFILTDDSIGTIDYNSVSAINSRTVEFNVINIVESGYVVLSAIDDARNATIASDGMWVSVCNEGKKINITNFLPSHLRESEVYDLMKFFEDFLNSMYYNKRTGCNISILEKINKLKDLKDINELDADYFQYFANHFGYEVNIDRESIGMFSTSNSDEEIDDYVRLSLKTLPNFNRLKSSEDAISIMLFSFGVIADILYLWTNDYNVNWKSESRYNNVNVKNEIPNTPDPYYPTPHFRVAVNYTQTPPAWIENFDKIVEIVNNIRPINTVFKDFSGYFEPVIQSPNDPLALGWIGTVNVVGKVVVPWVGPPASYGI
jgi:hypothetical protein